jgi:hypothetical protein
MSRNHPIQDKTTRTPTHFLAIRAFRLDDNQKECERRLQAFGLFAETLEKGSDARFALRIARALRAERKAAQTGGNGYDPMRHLVLARLDRRLRRRKRAEGRSSLL